MNTGLFWAIIVSVVILLVIYGMASSKLHEWKLRRHRRQVLPVVSMSAKSGIVCNVCLNSGFIFKEVKIAGLTEAPAGQFADFLLESWLVLEHVDGKRAFVKPSAVRYIEES